MMKKLLVVLCLLVAFLWAMPSPQTQAQAGCVNFLAYSDNTNLGSSFTLNGFAFQKLGGFNPFVNVFPDAAGNMVHGAQFPNAGLTINLPTPSGIIAILIGLFAPADATIQALNASGGVEDVQQITADNLLHNITLTQTTDPIVRLRITGGGGQGVIHKICH
jgi:hypothetical protein